MSSWLDIFKSDAPKSLEQMTPEERVVYFKKQQADNEKMMKKVKMFINQAIGLAELILGDEIGSYIVKFKPYIESFLTNPELIADELSRNIDLLCEKAEIPPHHFQIVVSKPKVVFNEQGEKQRNEDVMMIVRVFNPHFGQWQDLQFDVRKYLRGLRDQKETFDIMAMAKEMYNAKPDNAPPLQLT